MQGHTGLRKDFGFYLEWAEGIEQSSDVIRSLDHHAENIIGKKGWRQRRLARRLLGSRGPGAGRGGAGAGLMEVKLTDRMWV